MGLAPALPSRPGLLHCRMSRGFSDPAHSSGVRSSPAVCVQSTVPMLSVWQRRGTTQRASGCRHSRTSQLSSCLSPRTGRSACSKNERRSAHVPQPQQWKPGVVLASSRRSRWLGGSSRGGCRGQSVRHLRMDLVTHLRTPWVGAFDYPNVTQLFPVQPRSVYGLQRPYQEAGRPPMCGYVQEFSGLSRIP